MVGRKNGPAQTRFAQADVLVLASCMIPWLYLLSLSGVPLLAAPSAETVSAALAIAACQGVYPIVWRNNLAFMALCSRLGAHPVRLFEIIVLLGKLTQNVVLLAWATGNPLGSVPSMGGLWTLISSASAAHWVCCATLIAFGQGLNAAVYEAIGKNGVYYGVKLGERVPWSTGFPFSAGFRHAQYVGAYLSQMGLLALLASPANLAAGLVPLSLWWALLYAMNSYFEDD